MNFKLSTFLLCCFFPLCLNAQFPYHPLPTENTVWEQSYFGFAGTETAFYNSMCLKEVTDSTQVFDLYNLLVDDMGELTSTEYAGEIVENLNARKIWINYSSGFSELLYDFNLNVGDTLEGTNTMIVQQITTTFVNGEGRHTLVVSPCSSYPDEIWIAGLGSSQGIITRGNCAADFSPSTRCVIGSEGFFYEFPNQGTNLPCIVDADFVIESCASTVSTEDLRLADNTLAIYPNPSTKDWTEIIWRGKITGLYQLEIYSTVGELIYQKEITSNEHHRINTLGWTSGVYAIVLKNKTGEVLQSELFVQH